jgi:hypothetical protein
VPVNKGSRILSTRSSIFSLRSRASPLFHFGHMSLNLGKFADLLKEDPHSTQCHPLVKTISLVENLPQQRNRLNIRTNAQKP